MEKYRFSIGSPDPSGSFCDFKIHENEDEDDGFTVEGTASSGGCVHWQTDPNCWAHFCEASDVVDLAGTIIAAVRAAQVAMGVEATEAW